MDRAEAQRRGEERRGSEQEQTGNRGRQRRGETEADGYLNTEGAEVAERRRREEGRRPSTLRLRLEEKSEGGIVIGRSDTGERKSLPPELMPARPGEYRLRSTGEVVVDPDYVAKWVMREAKAEGGK